jgi:hypothetical protein
LDDCRPTAAPDTCTSLDQEVEDMQQDLPPEDPQRVTPDPNDPSHRARLADIFSLLRFHGFHVSEADVWNNSHQPVVVRVEGCDEALKDYALIREAVASGMHDPHTLVALYASDLRDRCRWRKRRRP